MILFVFLSSRTYVVFAGTISTPNIILILSSLTFIAKADLIPTDNNPFYYKMGGGQDISVPAYNYYVKLCIIII